MYNTIVSAVSTIQGQKYCHPPSNEVTFTSHRGQSRCRHFVINQNNAGLFVLEGDCRSHRSLKELIAHHKFSPIQPYGEYLTFCCSEVKLQLDLQH